MRGIRADIVAYKGMASSILIDIIDSPPPSITDVTITVKYQKNGDTLKVYTISQSASSDFTFEIQATDFSDQKPLNYWVEAKDQDDSLLFYGTFTLL